MKPQCISICITDPFVKIELNILVNLFSNNIKKLVHYKVKIK